MNREFDRTMIQNILELPFEETELGFWVRLNQGEDAVLFRPSTNMNDAWIVVKKLNEYGDFALVKDCDDSEWRAELAVSNIEIYGVSDESAPMAICRSATNWFYA